MSNARIESIVGNFAGIGRDSEVGRAACRFREFVPLAWKISEPATQFIPGFHLDAICEHLQAVSAGQIRNLVINIPPRHMKSLAVCVFWPAWEWISHPHRRFLFAAYTMQLSERDSVKCRRLIESPWYQQHFGHCFSLCPDQNTKMRYENDHAGHRIATSVGGSATGEGGDRIVVDDPHNVVDRQSEARRIEALTWWDETMSTRLNDPKTGAKIIVMQRIHEKDLSGHVLEQGGYEHLFLPAEFEPGRRCVTWRARHTSSRSDAAATCRVGVPAHHFAASPKAAVGEYAHPAQLLTPRWSDPRTVDGELLWPARIGKEEIADFKIRLGPEGYAGQFQQRPSPAGGALFRKEWFRYFVVGGRRDTETRGHGGAGRGSAEDAGMGRKADAAQTRGHGDAGRGRDAETRGHGDAEKESANDARLCAPSCSGGYDDAEMGLPEQIAFPISASPRPRVSASAPSYALLHPDGSQRLIRPEDCERFAVMDPAGTEPGEGRRPCYTVIQVWDVTRNGDMLLVHQYRRQVQAADAANAATKICREFDVAYIAIEKDGMGLGVVQQVRRDGIAVRAIKARGCKEARSQAAEIRMANGQIYFPHGADFLFELEKELLAFPRGDYADQVDALSHAAILVAKLTRPHETEQVEFWERDAEMALEADGWDTSSELVR
ncbi:MAG TPA: phage terminase large subunit [Tepidisphaeraceae bacterium]|jgi:predicted phage terminase large subunit-like protein|nr:phage terminase large subunit [Tepidisphaeraceae bacterium]